MTQKLKFKRSSQSLEQFFLTVGQNNFGSKMPFMSGGKFVFELKGNYVTYFGMVGTFVYKKYKYCMYIILLSQGPEIFIYVRNWGKKYFGYGTSHNLT